MHYNSCTMQKLKHKITAKHITVIASEGIKTHMWNDKEK